MRPVDGEVRKHRFAAVLAGPTDGYAVDFIGFSQAKRQGQLALAQVAAAASDLLPLRDAGGFQDHFGADGAAVGALAVAFEDEADPVMAGAALVAKQASGAAVFGQDDVEVAVAIDVRERAATADDRLEEVL